MRRFRLLMAGGALAVLAGVLEGQTAPTLPLDDRQRLAEALRVSELLRERLWPGWESVPAPILLVTDSAEYLVGHPLPTAEFRALGHDALLGREVRVRPRRLPPTLLATFPAVGGVPTAVVGTAARTGKTSADWVLAVLHEQFHQWQYTRPWYPGGVATLDLARGDTTGQWMLDFPFPYDSPPVQAAVEHLARLLAGSGTPAEIAAARRRVDDALTPEQKRYLDFQLWQEGTARWLEVAVARAAADAPPPAEGFRALADYEPYATVGARRARALREELDTLRLGAARRVAFYPIGAAMVELLEVAGGDWKRRYSAEPFRLELPRSSAR